MNHPKRVIVLACGGAKCCPELHTFEDGSTEIVDRDQPDQPRIRLNPGQTQALFDSLSSHFAREEG